MTHAAKAALKARMLELEQHELDVAREHYDEYLKDSQLDQREYRDKDEIAMARTAADLAHGFDHPIHAHEAKIEALRDLDFDPKDTVEPGAVVSFGGRHFVVAVSTTRFECDGQTYMGISLDSPIYQAISGLQAGESFDWRGQEHVIDEVT